MAWRSVNLGRKLLLVMLFSILLSAGPRAVGGTSGERSADPDSIETAASSDAAVFSTTTISIPTYPYAAYLTDAYNAGYGMTYPVLDWGRYNAANPVPVPKTYQLLVLENAYLKVTLLPELGGRLYQLIEKATGQNQLYQNPVIKPTSWGPPEQGWWLAVGGIEWCLPVDEHGYFSGVPWTWDVVSSTAGVTVTVHAPTGSSAKVRAAVSVFLPSDRAYVAVEPYLENPTYAPVDVKFWINAALAPGAANAPTEGLSFVLNAPEMAVHSTGDSRLPGAYPTMPTAPDHRFTWPVYEGVDYSALRNWNEWLGFFEYPQAVRGYAGVYDRLQDAGVTRVFPPDVAVGSKAFATGWAHALDWRTWTDGAKSGGVELHGGPAPTFWDTTRIAPYGHLTWREIWYPVVALGDLSAATAEAALRVTVSADRLRVGVHPTRAWAAGETELFVWDRTTCTELAHWTMPVMGPDRFYQGNLTVGERSPDQLAVAYVDADHNVLASYGPTDCLGYVQPDPHLGYGINLRDPARAASLVEPLGFEWVKLWEEYAGLPSAALTQHVLYNISCGAWVDDLAGWRSHVRTVAQAGLDRVQAYEICNEPNIRTTGWGGQAPNPQRFAEMLCIARQEIKAVDPHALVISGGLAPVGRIPPPWPCGEGNNCDAMDERLYTEALLFAGGGDCIDAFGYHPYGFAYPPEREPDLVSNGFAFRGVEVVRDLLVERGYGNLPVWFTEFGWIRAPAEDGYELGCDADPGYGTYFAWQEVDAATQAAYLGRAFAYADTHWPWVEGMFVWNLDWHDYRTWIPCFHSRYYALRRQDGTTLGAPTPAYAALGAMEKRPGPLTGPVLAVSPATVGLLAEVDDPRVLTTSLLIRNLGSGTFTWTATLSPTSTLTPVLAPLTGAQGERLWVTVDTTGLSLGVYTATLRIDAAPGEVSGSPQRADVVLRVVEELRRTYLPAILKAYASPSQPPPAQTPMPVEPGNPVGPSKIGFHAIADGGVTDVVQQVHQGGGHVALVKGLSFGYLCEVKQLSPQTITIGRWADHVWEAVLPTGDPAQKAGDYMRKHMAQWAPYKSCVDYWEVLNEVDPPTPEGHAWLGEFFKAAMPIAEANGYRLALFSYSMGVPELWEWEAIATTGVFARAQAGGHILSLHEYGGPLLSDRWGEPMPQYAEQSLDDPAIPLYPDRGVLGGRYRHLYRDILIPRGEVIPLAITEVNLAIEDPDERADDFLEDLLWYDDRLREDDYVLGMAIFTLGGQIANWGHFDYQDFLPELGARIVSLSEP